MPRSIQQLKHRSIFFDAISAEQLAGAVRVLEMLPGVSASADMRCQCIAVDYWVDEHTLSELEHLLFERGFPLSTGVRLRILRAEIQREEDEERDDMGARTALCQSGGVFAQVCFSCYSDCGSALPRLV